MAASEWTQDVGVALARAMRATDSYAKISGRMVERKHKAVLGVLSVAALAAGAAWLAEVRMNKRFTFEPSTAVFSHRTMQVTAPKETWKKLFATLEEFSRENGFTPHIRRIKKDVDLVLVHLLRQDVFIGGGNIVQVDQFLLQFHFDPTKGGSMAVVEELIPFLEKEMSTLQGVSVEVKRDD